MKQHKSFEIPKEQWEKLTFCKFRALVYDQVSEQLIFPIKRCENKLNFDFKEILENSELYMADFEKFNDVDEGRYLFYTNEEYNKELEKAIENIRDKKLKKEICSFSHYDEEAEWVLMWAHYANSHCGVRIDFKINPSYQGKVYQVKYTNKRPTYELGQVPQNLIKIMTTKSKCFSYEREYRAITESQDGDKEKLPIIIQRITLGRKFSNNLINKPGMKFSKNTISIAKQILEIWDKSKGRNGDSLEILAYTSRYSSTPEKLRGF